MTDKKRFPLFLLASLVFVTVFGTAMGGGQSYAATPVLAEIPSAESNTGTAALPKGTSRKTVLPSPTVAPAPPPNPWVNYPNVCETFNIIQSPTQVKHKKTGKKHYPVRYKKDRYQRSRKDRRRTRDLIEFVATEMGVAHPKFFSTFGRHESSLNPEEIHILDPDLSSNERAWKNHSYSRRSELDLEEQLANANARTKEYWRLKAQLANIRLYKGNTHWNDRLAYTYTIPAHELKDGTVLDEQSMEQSRNVWGFGYGLYGMYAVGYVRIWDQEAPPWILCADEGIVATIIQVWAARGNTTECNSLSAKDPERYGHEGGTYKGVLRRLARGHCSDSKLGPVWQRLMAENQTLPWESPADFGGANKWPRYEMRKCRGKRCRGKKWIYKKDENGKKIPTDRTVILAHMIKKAEAKGLLRPQPLQRKKPGSEAVVMAHAPRVSEDPPAPTRAP